MRSAAPTRYVRPSHSRIRSAFTAPLLFPPRRDLVKVASRSFRPHAYVKAHPQPAAPDRCKAPGDPSATATARGQYTTAPTAPTPGSAPPDAGPVAVPQPSAAWLDPRSGSVETMTALQAEYEAWRDQLPESMADSRTAELLEGVCAVGGTAGDPAASLKPGRRFPRGKGTDQIRAELHCKGLGGAGRRARRRTAARTGLGAPRAREPRGWSVPWNSLQRPSAELQRWR